MNVKPMERLHKRCVTNLLQWVWLDKLSDKLIWSSIRTVTTF